MNQRALREIALLLTVLTVTGSCSTASREPPASVRVAWEQSAESSLEILVLSAVNEQRRIHRLPELAWDPDMASIARRNSVAMAAGEQPFEHLGYAERERVVKRLVPIRRFGENLGSVEDPRDGWAIKMVEFWMASPSHRKNVLGCFDRSGVGAARDEAGGYWITQLFALQAGTSRKRIRCSAPAPQHFTRSGSQE